MENEVLYKAIEDVLRDRYLPTSPEHVRGTCKQLLAAIKPEHTKLQEAVTHQSIMESLWVFEPTYTEALLMGALRHLHALIEGNEEEAEEAKKLYWDVDSE